MKWPALFLLMLAMTSPVSAQDDPVICRRPQAQTESRLPGPRVCMPASQWDALKKQGLSLSADGRGTMASEKARTINRPACNGSGDSCY